jgi:hypothetical protein
MMAGLRMEGFPRTRFHTDISGRENIYVKPDKEKIEVQNLNEKTPSPRTRSRRLTPPRPVFTIPPSSSMIYSFGRQQDAENQMVFSITDYFGN